MDILIGFDGICVLHSYPNRGSDIKGAQSVLEELIQNGHHLILLADKNTEGKPEVISWFRKRGLRLHEVVSNNEQFIINKDNEEIPIINNEYISREPFVNWKKLRTVLVEKEILKVK